LGEEVSSVLRELTVDANRMQWFCVDPVELSDTTSFVLSLLQRVSHSDRSPRLKSPQLPDETKEISQDNRCHLEALPYDVIRHIFTFLPSQSLFNLRSCSRNFASLIPLDQHFWREQLFSGTLI